MLSSCRQAFLKYYIPYARGLLQIFIGVNGVIITDFIIYDAS